MSTLRQAAIQSSAVSSPGLRLDAIRFAEESRPSAATVEYLPTTPTPRLMAFVSLDDHHRLIDPILIEVTTNADGVTVADKLISRFGEGATEAEAYSDYACNVLDYFATLRDRHDHLSPRLARHLRILGDRIQEV